MQDNFYWKPMKLTQLPLTQSSTSHSSTPHLSVKTSKGSSTDTVHQLGEGTGGVPAAPLLMQLWQWREEVLEGAYTPRSRPGTAAVLGGPGATRWGGGVWWRPVTCRAGAGVAVPQKPIPLLKETMHTLKVEYTDFDRLRYKWPPQLLSVQERRLWVEIGKSVPTQISLGDQRVKRQEWPREDKQTN